MAHRTTWIKLHGDVFANKKVARAAAVLTRGDVEKMVGHLVRLWTWAVDNAEDGDLAHLSPAAIARGGGWQGTPKRFVQTLMDEGLLDAGPRIHDWDEYAGRLVERRKADRERWRLRKDSARTPAGVTAETPQEPRTDSATQEIETEKEIELAGSDTREGSALGNVLASLPGYTRDAALENDLAGDDGVDVIVEHLTYFADQLREPGQQPLTPAAHFGESDQSFRTIPITQSGVFVMPIVGAVGTTATRVSVDPSSSPPRR